MAKTGDTVAKYVVNIDEIKILMDKLSTKEVEIDFRYNNKIYGENFKVLKGENLFFIPLPMESGKIVKISYVLKDYLNGRNSLAMKLDDTVIIDNKPILDGKAEYVFPEPVLFSFSRIETKIVSDIDTEFSLNIFTKEQIIAEQILKNNCTINYRDYETEEILYSINFIVPIDKEFTFLGQPIFEDKELVRDGEKNVQKLDKYGFNISYPEFDDKMIFDFYYKEVI